MKPFFIPRQERRKMLGWFAGAENLQIQAAEGQLREAAKHLVADLIEVEPEHGLRKLGQNGLLVLAEAIVRTDIAKDGHDYENEVGQSGREVVPAAYSMHQPPSLPKGEEERGYGDEQHREDDQERRAIGDVVVEDSRGFGGHFRDGSVSRTSRFDACSRFLACGGEQ